MTLFNFPISHSQSYFPHELWHDAIHGNFKKMSKPMTTFCLALIFLHTYFAICRGVSVLGLNFPESSELDAIMKRGCSKKIGDCLEEPEVMETEISRRALLMQKKYVSYETLRRDMVPCTKPGASYYDCHAAAANPYNRGCEVITRCARAVQDIKT